MLLHATRIPKGATVMEGRLLTAVDRMNMQILFRHAYRHGHY